MNGLLNRLNRSLIVVTIALVAAVCLWFIAAYSIPFNPYRVNSLNVIPPTGCPGVPVQVRIDNTLRHPQGGRAGAYVLLSSWVNVASGQSIALPPYMGTFADNESGTRTSISPVLRNAPNLPGRWRLKSTMTIEGKVLRLDRDAIVPYQSDDVFETLDSEECS